MTAPIDALIADLGADLRPIRRLRPPLLRAAGWLGLVLVTGLVLAAFADLPGLAARLRTVPGLELAVLGSTLTSALAALAAFELSLPDRKVAWALVPVPGLCLWVAATGLGCLQAWVTPNLPRATMAEAQDCFLFIVSLSIPMSIVMVLMIRRACPLRPNLTAATAGLAVGAGAATLLNLFHPYDAGATDMAVHAAAVGVVVGLNRLLGGRLLGAGLVRSRL